MPYDVGSRPRTFVELLRVRADEGRDRAAYTFLTDGERDEVSVTYGALEQTSRAIATMLQLAGLRPGDRALLLYPPGLEYVASVFGCMFAGVVAVPAYPPDPARFERTLPRLQAIAADSGAQAVLTTGAIKGMVEFVGSLAPELLALTWLTTDELPPGAAAAWQPPPVEAATLAVLQYTSGSTSTPRGVMLSHANLLHNSACISQAFDLGADPVGVIWLPPYHDMGLIGGILQPLYRTVYTVLMSPLAFLQRPMRWLQAVSKYGAAASGGPNFAFDLCVRKSTPEERAALDLSRWEVAFCGAEPVRAETLDRFAEAFAPAGFRREAFYPCYGLAEGTLIVSGGRKLATPTVARFRRADFETGRAVPPSDASEPAVTLVGCGTAVRDQQIRIVQPENRAPCSEGEVGEIWVAGPSVARGYWQMPGETAAMFGARIAGEEHAGPFLRTGDLGFVRGGQLFIAGRAKDLVIIRGRNHYPQDIESTIERAHVAMRPGCGAAFAVEIDGEERLIVVQEFERRHRPDRRADAAPVSDAGRRQQGDRRQGDPDVHAFDGPLADAAAAAPPPPPPPAVDPASAIEPVRQAVLERHEVQPFAIVLIKAGTIPKTSSGKVQRRACRDAFLAGQLEVVHAWSARASGGAATGAGRSDLPTVPSLPPPVLRDVAQLTAWLVSQVARLAGVREREVDPRQPVIRYGLDSLRVVELLNRVETRLGVAVPVGTVLRGGSVFDLAEAISTPAAAAAAGPQLVPRPSQAPPQADAPLSEGQRALWFLEQLAPGSAAYNIVRAARAVSPLDLPALERAFQTLVDRHEVLRAAVVPGEDGAPRLRVAARARVDFAVEPVAADGGDAEAQIAARLEAEALRPFDLGAGSLVRVRVFTGAPRGTVVALAIHHIVSDFWSLGVMVDELRVAYAAALAGEAPALAPLPVRFADFVRWQGELLAAEEPRLWDFWRAHLADAPPALDAPLDRLRPREPGRRGALRTLRIERETMHAMRAFARAEGATLFTALLGAFAVVLARWTGQTDVVIGAPAAGRTRAALAGLVGYFVNPVPVRVEARGERSFAELLARTREALAGAVAHQDYPFARLVDRLHPAREGARTPVVHAMFALQQSHLPGYDALARWALGDEDGVPLELGPLRLEAVAVPHRGAQFDLGMMAAEVDGELAVSLEYNTELFDAATMDRLLGLFRALLAAAVGAPSRPLASLAVIDGEERARLLAAWAEGPAAELPAEAATLHELVFAQIARTPDAVAVRGPTERWTYAELGARARAIAARLRAVGVGPESRVAVLAARSPAMVAAVLGVLAAGAAYVPLDPGAPRERLAHALGDARVAAVVLDPALADQLPQPLAVPAVPHDATAEATPDAFAALPRVFPRGLAYVIYTSGSTGQPKGVGVEHRSAVNVVTSFVRSYALGPDDAVLQQTSLAFDVSVNEIFPVLSVGGTLVLPAAEDTADFERLVALMRSAGVTVMGAVPSVLARIAPLGRGLPRLRLVLSGGEALARADVEPLLATARVVNGYGPTETTVCATSFDLAALPRDPPRPIPIGRPLANYKVYVLDARMEPVAAGCVGEVYIGGVAVARGYERAPGATAARFVPSPFGDGERLYRTGDLGRWLPDGNLVFLGRADHQVKLRGLRIELGEIESVLRTHPAVGDAAVVVRDHAGAGRVLVAYVEPRAPAATSSAAPTVAAADARAFLRARLPEAMVPAAVVCLARLPRTAGGKVDRRALPEAELEAAGPSVPPRTPTEAALAEIWRDVLGRRAALGVHDHFFDVGGNSLLATQVVSRARERFGIELPVAVMFNVEPTIAALAEAIEQRLLEQAGDDVMAESLAEIDGLSDEEVRALLSEEMGASG